MSIRPFRRLRPAAGRLAESTVAGLPRGAARTRRIHGARPLAGAGPWILMGVPALFLAAFFYLPILEVLSRGFRGPGGGFSLSTATALLQDPYIQRLIKFTALQALGSSALSALIGVPMAHVLARTEFPGRRMVSALTMLPFILPSITVALGFLLMFGTNGWLNQALRAAFGIELRVLHSLWAILLAHAFYNAPVVARMTQAAWEQIDPRLEESARSLGASPLAAWRDVTLPATLSGIAGGMALAFIYSFMSFPIVLALGGARYATLEVEIYTNVHILWDWETGAALAAIQAALSLAFVYVALRLQGGPTAFGTGTLPGDAKRIPLFGRPSLGRLCAWLFVAACTVFFVGPIASIAVHALQGPGGGFDTGGFARIFSSRHSALIGNSPVDSIVTSLYFGAAAAAIAFVLGASFTYGLVRARPGGSAWIETLSLAPLVVSSVALALGSLILFGRPPFNAVPPDWRVIIVHSLVAFPFVVRAVRPVFAGLNPVFRESARTLGASPWRAFRSIELPLAAGGVAVALALAFGISVGETSATMMLARPGLVTMPVSVYRFLSARDFQSASAMALVLALVSGGVFAVVEIASRRLALRRGQEGGRRSDPGEAQQSGRKDDNEGGLQEGRLERAQREGNIPWESR